MGRGTNRERAGGGDAGSAARIDRWLWCVRLRGRGVKPAHALRPGDRLTVSVHGRELELEVLGIPARRGPAALAQAAYAETPASVARGSIWRAHQRLAAPGAPHPDARPGKRARRALIELARRQGRD